MTCSSRKQSRADGDFTLCCGDNVVLNWTCRRRLVIDPLLLYSTYLGGTGADVGHSIAVDNIKKSNRTPEEWGVPIRDMGSWRDRHLADN